MSIPAHCLDSNATEAAVLELAADFAARYPILSVHWPNLSPGPDAHAARLVARDRHLEHDAAAAARAAGLLTDEKEEAA